MSTDRTFQDMLNEYLPNALLREEFVKRDYLLTKVEKDNSWAGGTLIVPFRGANYSSVKAGGLTASNDIAKAKYVRGEVSSQKEIWGSLLFDHRDLMEHGKVSEQNFLKMLPDAVEEFMDYMKNVTSVNLLNGAHFATATDDGTAGGNLEVDRPDRFEIGQKVIIDDDNSSSTTAYVNTIDRNTKIVNFVTERDGSTSADLSGYTVAQNAKCYNDGFDDSSNPFESLRSALLSATNGGGSTLYGQTKTAYPYLQAINVDGSSITAVNIMEEIFDALTEIRQHGRGMPTDVIMSYKNFGSCIKVIEASKGAYNVTPGSQKASQYGWTELEVGSVANGGLKLVAVKEADDDVIMFVDWRALKFHSNGFFRKRMSPDGKEYYEIRATSGYQYILDVCLFGELVVSRPSYCGILHSISY